MNFAQEKYEIPDILFEITTENLGITDINVTQKEIQWKIIQFSKETESLVRRKDHECREVKSSCWEKK